MNFQPLYDRLLVERIEAPSKQGSLYVPDQAKPKPSTGRVLAVGHGVIGPDGNMVNLKVREGDVVYFGQFSGDEIELDGQTRLILREAEIFGIISGE